MRERFQIGVRIVFEQERDSTDENTVSRDSLTDVRFVRTTNTAGENGERV